MNAREAFPEMKGFSKWFHLATLLTTPIGEYQIVPALPVPLDTALPTIEEVDADFSRDLDGKLKERR